MGAFSVPLESPQRGCVHEIPTYEVEDIKFQIILSKLGKISKITLLSFIVIFLVYLTWLYFI